MTVPAHIRKRLQDHLWKQADDIGWLALSSVEKSTLYDLWVREEKVGGLLSHFIHTPDIRVYLHSLMTGYTKSKLADPMRPLRVLRISSEAAIEERFSNPLGCLLKDGRLITWGKASSWKSVILGLHERAHVRDKAKPYGAVLFNSTGRYKQTRVRRLIEDAGYKLGVERIEWLET